MSKAKVEETRMLQAVWVKALREGKVEHTLATIAEAQRMRFALYNAVRGVRKGTEVDAMLLQATEEVALQLKGATITLVKRTETSMWKSLEAMAAGQELRDGPVSVEKLEIEMSRKRLEQLLGAGAGTSDTSGAEGQVSPGARTTPYFTRG